MFRQQTAPSKAVHLLEHEPVTGIEERARGLAAREVDEHFVVPFDTAFELELNPAAETVVHPQPGADEDAVACAPLSCTIVDQHPRIDAEFVSDGEAVIENEAIAGIAVLLQTGSSSEERSLGRGATSRLFTCLSFDLFNFFKTFSKFY